jgi:hypothetical protein
MFRTRFEALVLLFHFGFAFTQICRVVPENRSIAKKPCPHNKTPKDLFF